MLSVFGETFNDFATNTSIHGVQYLTARRRRTFLERSLWGIIEIIAVSLTIFMLLFSWNEFMDEPIVTTLESPNYPVTNIPFPGIAICNINKISLNLANKYGNYLSNKTGLPLPKIFELINMFGRMYDAGNTESEEDLSIFQNILNEHDFDNKTGNFDTHATLKKLAIPCTELLSDCYWHGISFDCKDLFVFSTTMEGFCCVFNYVSQLPDYPISRIMKLNNNMKLFPKEEGLQGGLSVTVHSNASDYFYPSLSSVGANVHIFNSEDYPDTSSGGLQERVVGMNMQLFIRLYGTATYAIKEVKRYSIQKRNCKFRDEARTLLGSKYTFSDCILECRLNSMLSLCQCIPFMFIKTIYDSPRAQCSLIDMPCIHRYRDKWRRLYPHNFVGHDELDREKQDSLICSHCVPSCNSTLYTVKNDFTYLSNDVLNYSIVHIFFETNQAQLYKHDVVYYWFEIMSNFGGSCSLVIGISLISGFELVYYVIVVLSKNLRKQN